MKITVDVDITPEELRRFLGLPNVEKLQEELLENAGEYLRKTGQAQYADLIAGAMQPVFAYQKWMQNVLTGHKDENREEDESK